MCLAGSFLAIKQKSKRRSGEAARKFKSVSRCFHTIYTAKFMDPESSLNLTYWEITYTGKKTLFLPSTYTTNNISQWSASRRTPVKHSSSAFLWFIFAHDVRNVKCIRSLSHDAESLRIVNLSLWAVFSFVNKNSSKVTVTGTNYYLVNYARIPGLWRSRIALILQKNTQFSRARSW